MKKIFLLIPIYLIISESSVGQNEVDALRYSVNNIFGTARFVSMGGSFGALGGDLSVLSYNPAGLGMYQFNESSFTPSFDLNSTTSYFGSSQNNDSRLSLNLSNFGAVFSNPRNTNSWERLNFGVGINQLANYSRNTYIDGYNKNSSLADNFLLLADGNTIDRLNSFHSGPAFWTDVIDLADNTVDDSTNWYLFDDGNYISHIAGNKIKRQTKDIRSSGSLSEFTLAVATSYEDKLYLGATIGFPGIDYYENSLYRENEFDTIINGLEGFEYEEDLSVSGTGVNLKLGVIARLPISNVRIAAALHSPTYYKIEETYKTSITAHFNNEDVEESSPNNFFTYQLLTPWKIITSISANLHKNILLNADYEIIDYTFSEMHSDGYRFEAENKTIEDLYVKATNIRLGGELRLRPFNLRCGYAVYESPYKEREEYSTENFTFGAGFQHKNYYFDIAYIYSKNNDEYLLYNESFISPIEIVDERNSLIFTLGFKY